jgi:hypothetical protein
MDKGVVHSYTKLYVAIPCRFKKIIGKLVTPKRKEKAGWVPSNKQALKDCPHAQKRKNGELE